MARKIFLSLLGLCLVVTGFSQRVFVSAYMLDKRDDPYSDTIYYSSKRLLTWDDFQGAPQPNSIAGAITCSGFAYNAGITINEDVMHINIGVYTYFDKVKSWKKPIVHTDYHLEHEQHHFDITLLGAERFIEEVRKAHFTRDNYKELLNEIFDRVYQDDSELQETYDAQTEHSINKEMQYAWNLKINKAVGRENIDQ